MSILFFVEYSLINNFIFNFENTLILVKLIFSFFLILSYINSSLNIILTSKGKQFNNVYEVFKFIIRLSLSIGVLEK